MENNNLKANQGINKTETKEKFFLREGLTKTNIKINGTPIKIEDRPIATPRSFVVSDKNNK